MRSVVYFLLLCASLPPQLRAQEPAGAYAISGTVSDPTGAGIPNADVRVRQRGTASAVAEARTGSLGNFYLPGVAAGSLEIEVSHEGFASQTVRIAIRNRAPAPLRIELKLAAVHQAVTV